MKLERVEASRGIAALLVVLLHATGMLTEAGHQPFGGLFLFGRAGVDFFFVLSGFIIAHVHADDLGRPARAARFWRKRLLRVYPTYWAAFLLFGAILAVSPTALRTERDPVHLIASLFLLPDPGGDPILLVAWSLRHELLFYALFSVAILHRGLGLTLMGAWFAAILFSLVWQVATGQPWFTGGWNYLPFRIFNIEFLFGLAAAAMFRRGDARWPMAVMASGTAVFVLNGLAESFLPRVQPEWPIRHLLYAFGSAVAIWGMASLDRQGRGRVPRPLLTLGGASYALYLTHTTVLLLISEGLRRTAPFLDLPAEIDYVVAVSIAVAAGVAFHRHVERPLLRVVNRLFDTGQPPHGRHSVHPVQRGHGGLDRDPRGHAGQDVAVVQSGAEDGPVPSPGGPLAAAAALKRSALP